MGSIYRRLLEMVKTKRNTSRLVENFLELYLQNLEDTTSKIYTFYDFKSDVKLTSSIETVLPCENPEGSILISLYEGDIRHYQIQSVKMYRESNVSNVYLWFTTVKGDRVKTYLNNQGEKWWYLKCSVLGKYINEEPWE